eukprot:CAMPEP_0113937036 /NCGR_PEP_ID=MMETSP1339-20121228/3743_1 /TAXON_ID=94617 /ORGANISM="Fibrocapsa japonica" /LENGTH=444 /DNA_ID=CAMNT_0000939649 /DNA_START=183 /DNA_END=1517 /DNA_ORIENTATION=- /assembly_acc=CAM_ASM_000762
MVVTFSTDDKSDFGEILSSSAIIAGNTIGGGILALPLVSTQCGFLPSAAIITIIWTLCYISGLFICEAAITNSEYCKVTPSASSRSGLTEEDSGEEAASMLELAEQSLGQRTGLLAWTGSLIVNYALLIAYIAQCGQVLEQALPSWMAPLVGEGSLLGSMEVLVTAGTALLVAGASSAVLDITANGLMVVVFASFAALVGGLVPGVDPESLMRADTSAGAALPLLPVALCALVFHNVLPAVTARLGCDRQKVSKSVFWGTFIPLLMYLCYDFAVLGSLGSGLEMSSVEAVFDTLKGPVTVFSFSTLITSLIGSAISLQAEWRGIFSRNQSEGKGEEDDVAEDSASAVVSSTLTYLPPLAVALASLEGGGGSGSNSLFLACLDVVGTYIDPLLYGLLPVAMVWQQRYGSNLNGLSTEDEFVPGGKPMLSAIAATYLMFMVGSSVL